ncbi:hypothetical protein M2175_004634 [Bradyrhizobium elkanii]|uniref:hypothetical protein n=1 Tax=Bradyrhizobium TaxID=374 RepID=UPI0021693A52|nr:MULTISPECIES: hypothetical protein [Bradyrhizobium]MCS3929603.1 hypothetical protein [Bradyrhizobium elkanii]MCS3970160.1 hypothetical protein [Bradyrhizobium japonicum]
MLNIHEDNPQHNVAWSLLPALLIPQNGTSLHTITAPGGVKVLANVDMRTGCGLPRRARRVASAAHDVCQVFVHADIREADGTLPAIPDFHAPTLLWAVENAEQIALWCERGTSLHPDVSAWIVNAAYKGSRFQTTINATPEQAADWLAYVTRWKSKDAKLRVFGPEAL